MSATIAFFSWRRCNRNTEAGLLLRFIWNGWRMKMRSGEDWERRKVFKGSFTNCVTQIIKSIQDHVFRASKLTPKIISKIEFLFNKFPGLYSRQSSKARCLTTHTRSPFPKQHFLFVSTVRTPIRRRSLMRSLIDVANRIKSLSHKVHAVLSIAQLIKNSAEADRQHEESINGILIIFAPYAKLFNFLSLRLQM